jgi:hypothetical protein
MQVKLLKTLLLFLFEEIEFFLKNLLKKKKNEF